MILAVTIAMAVLILPFAIPLTIFYLAPKAKTEKWRHPLYELGIFLLILTLAGWAWVIYQIANFP